MSKLLPIQPKNQSVEVENSLATIIESTVVLKKSLFNFKKFFVDRMRTDKKEVRVEKRQTFLELQQKERDKKERTLEKNTRPKNAGSGVVGKAAAAGGSLLDKLLGAGIMLALGWLVKWLPSIIDKVTLFFKNLGNLLNSIKNVVVAMGDTMKGVVAVVMQTLENWRNFDFFDANGKIQEKMDELNSNWDKVGKEWDNTVRDFNKLKNDAMSSMETQEQRTTYRNIAGGGSVESGDLFEIIASGEGGYNSVNRGRAGDTPDGAISILGKNLTDMTVDEVYANQYPKGVGLHAVGKYQIIPITMPGFITYLKNQGIDTSKTKFDASLQERYRDYVVDSKRPIVGRYIRGESNDRTEAAQEIAREFASVGAAYAESVPGFIPAQRGDTLYAGRGDNAASVTPEEIEAALDRARSAFLSGRGTSTGQTVATGQTVVLAGGTNTYGAPELAAQEMTAAIKNLKSKGYNVVVVPPNEKDRQFKPAYESIRDAATQEGVEVIRAEYDTNDPLHLSSQAVTAIRAKYPNAIYMGDSNAARLAGDRGKVNVREEGAGTDTILEFAQKLQRAAQPAAAVRPQTNQQVVRPQTNQQTGQVSPRETAASRISGNNQLSSTSLVSTPAPSVAPVRQTMASRSGVTVAVVNVPQPIPARRKSQFAMSVGGGGEDVETTLNRIAKVLLAYT